MKFRLALVACCNVLLVAVWGDLARRGLSSAAPRAMPPASAVGAAADFTVAASEALLETRLLHRDMKSLPDHAPALADLAARHAELKGCHDGLVALGDIYASGKEPAGRARQLLALDQREVGRPEWVGKTKFLERLKSDAAFWDLVDQLFKASDKSLQQRIRAAHRLHRERDYPDLQHVLCAGMETWLKALLILPPPKRGVPANYREALGWSRKMLVVAEFKETKTENVWEYELDGKTYVATTQGELKHGQLAGAPKMPFPRSARDQFAERAGKAGDRWLEIEAWQALLETCNSLEKEAAKYRELANQEGTIRPALYRDAYREVSFITVAEEVHQVVACFDLIMEICRLASKEPPRVTASH
jgi:hypothetical protein